MMMTVIVRSADSMINAVGHSRRPTQRVYASHINKRRITSISRRLRTCRSYGRRKLTPIRARATYETGFLLRGAVVEPVLIRLGQARFSDMLYFDERCGVISRFSFNLRFPLCKMWELVHLLLLLSFSLNYCLGFRPSLFFLSSKLGF